MSPHFSRDKEPSSEEIVEIFDEKGRSLKCYIEHSLETGGITYLLLMPVDIPIVIISWDDDSDAEEVEAVLLEDDQEIEQIFDNAQAVLAEQNLSLQHTGYSLTAIGELPPIEEEQLLTLNLEEEDSDVSDLEAEELQLLASFYHSQQKYSIYTPLTPLLFFARYNRNHELELVSPEEENFQPILEELLFEEFDER